MPSFAKSALAALVAALAVASAAAADPSRKTLELTADAATTAEMELGFDTEGARRRALQGEYASGNVDPLGPDVSGPDGGQGQGQGSAAIVEIIQRRGGGGGSF